MFNGSETRCASISQGTVHGINSSVKLPKSRSRSSGASPNQDTPEPLLLLRIEETSAEAGDFRR
ncbi:MAG: hypothetical protein O2960_22740, partial [Verrucomicrobia bacterium]|nr:hypothetical protein [Verrucomicrobiota bacterium]